MNGKPWSPMWRLYSDSLLGFIAFLRRSCPPPVGESPFGPVDPEEESDQKE